MLSKFLSLLTLFSLLLGCGAMARAAEVDCDTVYCFSAEDFASEDALKGICITSLPEKGRVMLGDRNLRPGDILAADQLAQMTFCPLRSEEDANASVTYLPIFEDRVAPSATMTIAIRGKENHAPAAEDFAVETYKNLPIDGQLKVKEPEGEAMTFTLLRQPKRGEVVIREDGSFTYTPKKNKVGIDSFVYTATDPAGKVSREATVTITIVKPTDAMQYTDTIGKSCRFAAEWMKNTGIFVGERLDGNACFSPEEVVTRGEFVTMLVKALDIPTDQKARIYSDEIPTWLQPYVAAAVRAGLTAGLPERSSFGAEAPITGGEAAVMLQNALELSSNGDTAVMAQTDVAEWARNALQILSSNGIALSMEALTRADAAEALYTASLLAENAPGMEAIK